MKKEEHDRIVDRVCAQLGERVDRRLISVLVDMTLEEDAADSAARRIEKLRAFSSGSVVDYYAVGDNDIHTVRWSRQSQKYAAHRRLVAQERLLSMQEKLGGPGDYILVLNEYAMRKWIVMRYKLNRERISFVSEAAAKEALEAMGSDMNDLIFNQEEK